jgi:hypothetical protein
MFKKHLLVMMIVVLAALLVFTGCPTSSGTDTSPESVPQTPYVPSPVIPRPKDKPVTSTTPTSEINNQLSSSSTSTVTLSASATTMVTTDDTLVVPAGKGLNIGENVTVKIPSGQDADIRGTMNVAEDAAIDFSDIPTSSTNAVTLSGTISVAQGGKFYGPESSGGATPQFVYGGSGKIVLQGGSTAYMKSGAANVAHIGPSSVTPIFEWEGTSGSLELTEDLFTLKNATVKVAQTGYIASAVIGSGSTLKIDANLTIIGTITGVPGVQIIISSGVTLGGSGLNNTANFYQNANTSKEAATANKTYIWTADAGGTGVAGWKADS